MMKKLFTILLASLIAFAAVPVQAADKDGSKGQTSKKDEVIYANLNADGSEADMYVVNALHVKKAGQFTDYGDYGHIKNLTDMTDIVQKEDQNSFTAEKGKFYYQGELQDKRLPWQFNIQYKLDGERVTGQELVGASGELEVAIETKHDKEIDQTFFENYLLQVSLTFDGEKTENIRAEEGTLANNGKKELVNFSVMPEEDAKLKVVLDVEDFEMESIEISAIPANISVDLPDTDEMIGDMQTLVDAISDLDKGIGDLKSGADQLQDGSQQVADGSSEFQKGLNQLDASSGQLLDGSQEIQNALNQVKSGLDDFDMEAIDFSALEDIRALADDFNQAIDMMEEMDLNIDDVKAGFDAVYQNVDQVTAELSQAQLTDQDIAALKESDLDEATVERIIALSESSQAALDLVENTKPTLDEINDGMENYQAPIQDSLQEIKAAMETIESINIEAELKSLMQMVDGLKALASQYNQFHAGLNEYVSGVGELSQNYGELNGGMADLNQGILEFSDGIASLKDGSHELASKTSNLPKEMTDEIDEMMSAYDMSDFEPVSFVSDKNENIDVVQFVIQTEDLEKPDKDDGQAEEKEELSFWEKIKNLFKRD